MSNDFMFQSNDKIELGPKLVEAHPLIVAERETGEAVKEMTGTLIETAAENIEHTKSIREAQEKTEAAIHRLIEQNILTGRWTIASVIINGLALLAALITLIITLLK